MAERKINEQELAAVKYYCDEDSKKTFLNKHASYEKAYFTDKGNKPYVSWKSESNRFWKKAKVRKAIEENMGKVAYNLWYIRNEYREVYEMAKEDRNLSVAKNTLDSMAKTEAMFETKTDDNTVDNIKSAVALATQETLEKIKASKETGKKQTEILEYKEAVK